MTQALIGHTGFVGGVLHTSEAYDAVYNSKTIEQMRGQAFDRVVCAGVKAVKWQANADPETDRAGIDQLTSVLADVEVDRFVLISTVDVYPSTQGLDEDAVISRQDGQPYGRHRLYLEDWVTARYPGALIVRLPALFGPGLKKNIIFDLANDHETYKINEASSFQWYDLTRLPQDLRRAEGAGLPLVNLVPEPIATATILERVFPKSKVGTDPSSALHYDVRTKHAGLFGGANGYICSHDESLTALEAFVRTMPR